VHYSCLLVRKVRQNFSVDSWVTASQTSNEWTHSTSTKFRAFVHSGLELRFCQSYTAEHTGEVEFSDVNHCITTEDNFVFAADDFLKHAAVKSSSLTVNRTTQNDICVNHIWRSNTIEAPRPKERRLPSTAWTDLQKKQSVPPFLWTCKRYDSNGIKLGRKTTAPKMWQERWFSYLITLSEGEKKA